VSVVPTSNDRVPAPSVKPVSQTVGPTTTSVSFTGLESDCHQMYVASVSTEEGSGLSSPAASSTFRPSGIVKRGKPPYVVILLDGVSESKPGFTMKDPYKPTNAGTPSYCPESSAKDGPTNNPFKAAPNGPREFFNKWNYFDPNDTANNNVPLIFSNSTPVNLKSREQTHSFMLDAIAATGAVILPFSYNGALLNQRPGSDPTFTFPAYTACNSSPPPGGWAGCDKDPGGSPDPRTKKDSSWSIQQDEQKLADEVKSVRAVWHNVPIVILGHSQGGLIAFDAWQQGKLPGVKQLFSLDSPINGVCPSRITAGKCDGVAGYPDYDSRVKRDKKYLLQDSSSGNPFRFIGTWGDSVNVDVPLFGGPAYGTGDETLQHQLLVKGSHCVDDKHNSDCPDQSKGGPDHISECPIPKSGWVQGDQHFIVKFCPGNVA
jgi:dienelactone hydrolase